MASGVVVLLQGKGDKAPEPPQLEQLERPDEAATSPAVFVTDVAPSVSTYPAPKPQEPGQISATEHASGLRDELCSCETRECIDEVNARYVQTIGNIAPSTYDETSRAEMRAGAECVSRLLVRLAERGSP
jgi:hypothetical protein